MKQSTFLNLLALSVVLAIGVVGCKSPQKGITPIPGRGAKPVTDPNRGGLLAGGQMKDPSASSENLSGGGLKASDLDLFEGMVQDRSVFASDTVYFDFDRSTIKASETSKVEAVAAYYKSNKSDKLLIEGHCDERGTEEYNRSLGDRRASKLREHLVRLGVDADRIRTLSFGEDKPAVQGHDEAAWSKNRRGEFIVLKPKN